jgi:hypothetical protein
MVGEITILDQESKDSTTPIQKEKEMREDLTISTTEIEVQEGMKEEVLPIPECTMKDLEGCPRIKEHRKGA